LWRLNQALFPEPGRPMESTTVPLGSRGGVEGGGTLAAVAPVVSSEAVRATGECAGDAAGRELRPRPPLPRRRRLRRPPSPPPCAWGAGCDSRALSCSDSSGGWTGARTGSGPAGASGGTAVVSASKYLGCKGVGAGSLAGFWEAFLRRFSRSLIHLRMFGL
jgi:hypothetical protein